MKNIKEDYDERLLKLEWVIGLISSVSFLTLVYVASYIEMEMYIRVLLISIGVVIFGVGIYNCVKIEQVAGYYECDKCHNKYVPTFSSVLWSMHFGRTRYMKCPKCGERSWNKKVIRK